MARRGDFTVVVLLAVGTRGNAAVERLILGSVAEGAINRARVPVLVTP